MKPALLPLLVILFCTQTSHSQDKTPLISSFEQAVITEPPADINPFYKKYTDAYGIPVVASEKVPDAALLVARDNINYMLQKRPDIRAAMIKLGARLMILGQNEQQTDLPEYADWKKPTIDDRRLTPSERDNYNKPGGIASMGDKEYWNKRARGMGG